jgi:hypothetical protein
VTYAIVDPFWIGWCSTCGHLYMAFSDAAVLNPDSVTCNVSARGSRGRYPCKGKVHALPHQEAALAAYRLGGAEALRVLADASLEEYRQRQARHRGRQRTPYPAITYGRQCTCRADLTYEDPKCSIHGWGSLLPDR